MDIFIYHCFWFSMPVLPLLARLIWVKFSILCLLECHSKTLSLKHIVIHFAGIETMYIFTVTYHKNPFCSTYFIFLFSVTEKHCLENIINLLLSLLIYFLCSYLVIITVNYLFAFFLFVGP